ncbi:alpha/beta hydrolase [Alphaproteobacteria bacterium]|nr:alpha/beta hydrolase [Alphaproteobacteria bacterium]
MSVVKSVLFVVLVGYIGAQVVLYAFQDRIIYPSTGAKQTAEAPFAEVSFKTADGLDLYAWYAPPATRGAATIIYFHGNAAKMLDAAYSVRPLVEAGYGMLIVEYRGYAGNPGTPSEAAFYADAADAYDWLKKTHDPKKIVLYGMSIGTGVATRLATLRKASGLVLEGGFTSLTDVAAEKYWYLPARWLLRDRYDSLARLPELKIPLLIVHGDSDWVVPAAQARRNFAAAGDPKEMVIIPGGHHSDLPYNGANAAVQKWLTANKI